MRVEGRDSDDWMAVDLGQSQSNLVPNSQGYLIINSSPTPTLQGLQWYT